MRCTLRRLRVPCLAISITAMHAGCSHGTKPPAAERPNYPFREYNEVQRAYEERLKTSNAEIIEQLLTAYHRGSDPGANVDDQRQAELALHAAMVKLEFWYTHGGRDYLLPSPPQSE
jgi:hypothetical protein